MININTLYTNIYLEEYITLKGIDLKKELLDLDVSEIPIFLEKNGLSNMFSKYLYYDFIKGKELEEMNLAEKIIALQYTIENFDITKEQLEPLISSF